MNFKKIVSLALIGTCLSTSSLVFAAPSVQNLKSGVIPGQMLPGTVLMFNQANEPVVITEGSNLNSRFSMPTTDLSNENKSVPDSLIPTSEFYKILAEIQDEAKTLPIFRIPDEKPQPGTIVKYGTDGKINSIENGVPTPAVKGTAANGTYTYGNSNNKITITSSKVSGVGRFTVFDDKYGDIDNILVAGDVATKAAYDNPKSGSKLTATATDTSVTKTVTKNDNGSLPDAVLDVKRWSGTLFGYTYSSSLSFPGSYYYNR